MLWLSGVVGLATSAAWSFEPLLVAAWAVLALAAAALGANVVGSLRAATIVLPLPALLVGLGQAFLPAGIILALASTLADSATAPFTGPVRTPLAILLLAGWIGMTVAGALLQLVALLGRVRRFSLGIPVARPGRDRPLVGVGVVVAALAAWALSHVAGLDALGRPAAAVVAAATAAAGFRILVLAWRALRPSPRHDLRPS